MRRCSYNVGAITRRRFKLSIEASGEHLVSPTGKESGGPGAPFRGGDTNVPRSFSEIQVDRGMIGQGRKGTLGYLENRGKN